MKMTLLEMTQDVLNDMSSDEVNDIDDTTESQQVAQIIKSTFFSLMDSRDWPHTKKLVQITPSGDPSLPTHMYLDGPIKQITLVNYDKAKLSDGSRKKYSEVLYLEPDDFLRRCNNRDNTQATSLVVTDKDSGMEFIIRNDSAPTYYTSFNDSTLIFDSYDRAIDDTIQKSKIQVYAFVTPKWTHTNEAYPDLPDNAFTYLLEEAKSRCAFKIRQQPDQKAEQASQQHKKWLARKDRKVAQGIKFPNYGRK